MAMMAMIVHPSVHHGLVISYHAPLHMFRPLIFPRRRISASAPLSYSLALFLLTLLMLQTARVLHIVRGAMISTLGTHLAPCGCENALASLAPVMIRNILP